MTILRPQAAVPWEFTVSSLPTSDDVHEGTSETVPHAGIIDPLTLRTLPRFIWSAGGTNCVPLGIDGLFCMYDGSDVSDSLQSDWTGLPAFMMLIRLKREGGDIRVVDGGGREDIYFDGEGEAGCRDGRESRERARALEYILVRFRPTGVLSCHERGMFLYISLFVFGRVLFLRPPKVHPQVFRVAVFNIRSIGLSSTRYILCLSLVRQARHVSIPADAMHSTYKKSSRYGIESRSLMQYVGHRATDRHGYHRVQVPGLATHIEYT